MLRFTSTEMPALMMNAAAKRMTLHTMLKYWLYTDSLLHGVGRLLQACALCGFGVGEYLRLNFIEAQQKMRLQKATSKVSAAPAGQVLPPNEGRLVVPASFTMS